MATTKINNCVALCTEQKKTKQIILADYLTSASYYRIAVADGTPCNGTIFVDEDQFIVKGWGRQLSYFEKTLWSHILYLSSQVPTGKLVEVSRVALLKGLDFKNPDMMCYEWQKRQLDCFEQNYWSHVYHISSQVPDGEPVEALRTALRKGLDFKNPDMMCYEWLHWALTGLSTFNFEVDNLDATWMMPILSYSYDKTYNKYRIAIDPRWTRPINGPEM
jgi:hypothetical protein